MKAKLGWNKPPTKVLQKKCWEEKTGCFFNNTLSWEDLLLRKFLFCFCCVILLSSFAFGNFIRSVWISSLRLQIDNLENNSLGLGLEIETEKIPVSVSVPNVKSQNLVSLIKNENTSVNINKMAGVSSTELTLGI